MYPILDGFLACPFVVYATSTKNQSSVTKQNKSSQNTPSKTDKLQKQPIQLEAIAIDYKAPYSCVPSVLRSSNTVSILRSCVPQRLALWHLSAYCNGLITVISSVDASNFDIAEAYAQQHVSNTNSKPAV